MEYLIENDRKNVYNYIHTLKFLYYEALNCAENLKVRNAVKNLLEDYGQDINEY